MRRTILAIVVLLMFSTPSVAQQWDQVNGSMQVRSGPTAPLVIIDQTTAGQKIVSFRTNGTEKCSVNVSGDFTCIGTMTLGPSGALTVSSTAVTSTVPIRHPVGTQAAPGIAFSDDTSNGIFSDGGDNLYFVANNAGTFGIIDTQSTYRMPGTWKLGWASGAIIGAATDVDMVRVAAGVFGPAAGHAFGLASKAFINTAPTVPVACTSPTVTWSNGTATFQVDVGGTCAGVSTLSLTMPAATNAWMCEAMNVTTSATGRMELTASTSTSITFTSYTRTTGVALVFVDGADIRIACSGG